MLTALCDNISISEVEFLRRELGIKLQHVDSIKIKPSKFNLIVSHQPIYWESFLKKAPANSTIFILLGNETYDSRPILQLNGFSSLRVVYIYNAPRLNKLISLWTVLGFLCDSPKSLFTYDFYRTWKNAYDFARKTRNLQKNIDFEFKIFPQGYTNRFVFELKFSGLLSKKYNKSLLEYNFPIYDFQKIPIIGFVGGKSNWLREKILDAFNKVGNFKVYRTTAWGGSNQGTRTIFVDTILSSKCFLNPPGNITNETHKYWEVLLLNRLPVCSANSHQDHHFNNYWSQKYLKGINKYSYTRQSRYILRLSKQKYTELVNRAKEDLRDEIYAIQTQLYALKQE